MVNSSSESVSGVSQGLATTLTTAGMRWRAVSATISTPSDSYIVYTVVGHVEELVSSEVEREKAAEDTSADALQPGSDIHSPLSSGTTTWVCATDSPEGVSKKALRVNRPVRICAKVVRFAPTELAPGTIETASVAATLTSRETTVDGLPR